MQRTEVAVIGGGLAGLCAARLLNSTKTSFVLLEARHRFGGRILTLDASGQSTEDGFDVGPSWFWPQQQPAVAELIGELALDSFPQSSEGDLLFERMSREGVLRYSGVVQEVRTFRLVGGTSALIHALSRSLAAEDLRLGTRVVAMALTTDGVELTTRQEGDPAQTSTLLAERVIAALPPRLLEDSVRFTPDLQEPTTRRWRDTPTWMAPHAKFFALYERPFWREAGLSGSAQSMVGPMVEIHDATTASGQGALFGFIGLSAQQRQALGDEAITGACMDQLGRIFGPEARVTRATLLKDWAADPLTATSNDQVAGGHPTPNPSPWVCGPWSERLVLAGSEASPRDPGYLEGAVVAAAHGVSQVRSLSGAQR